MASNYRRITVIGKEVVDVSREIVFDAMYMTADVLHSIRNNLPMEMSSAQVTIRREGSAPQRIAPRRGFRVLGLLALLTLIVAGVMGGKYAMEQKAKNEAITAATGAFWKGVAPIDTNSKAFRAEAAVYLDKKGDPAKVLAYLDVAKPAGAMSIMEREIYLSNVLAAGDFLRARTLALELLREAPESELAVGAYTTSFKTDPTFSPELESMTASQLSLQSFDPETMEAKVTVNGTAWRWIPSIDTDQDRWQTPIAAYRLCVVIACEFEVSQARGVQLPWQEVAYLFAGQPEILERFNALGTTDGEWVQGALVEDVPLFARFPVERARTWRKLVDADKKLKVQPASKALSRWAKRNPAVYHNVGRIMKDTTSVDLARQISSLMVFDFLAGNYRRFERSRKDYGKNLSMKDGRIWSVQSENLFGTRPSKRVKGRIKWVERFSDANVSALSAADIDVLAPNIFPGVTKKEASQARLLARQSKELVRRVGALKAKYGQDILL